MGTERLISLLTVSTCATKTSMAGRFARRSRSSCLPDEVLAFWTSIEMVDLTPFGLRGGPTVQPDFYQLAWRRNLGGAPPEFSEEKLLADVNAAEISLASSWHDGERSGLIIQHGEFQQLSFFELTQPQSDGGGPRFRQVGRAESMSAVMSLSDQAWPCLCDWDDDGDFDLLIGGGYGWPRVAINFGSRQRPAFGEPARILSEGKPIRFVRNEILGEPAKRARHGLPVSRLCRLGRGRTARPRVPQRDESHLLV